MTVKKKAHPKKAHHKWRVKKLELQCVGMQHRLTLSTRRFMLARVKSKPIQVEFKREPDNSHDENAIAVWTTDDPDNPYRKMQVGFVPRLVAAELAPALDSGDAELGKSFIYDMSVQEGIADLQVNLRVKRGVKVKT